MLHSTKYELDAAQLQHNHPLEPLGSTSVHIFFGHLPHNMRGSKSSVFKLGRRVPSPPTGPRRTEEDSIKSMPWGSLGSLTEWGIFPLPLPPLGSLPPSLRDCIGLLLTSPNP